MNESIVFIISLGLLTAKIKRIYIFCDSTQFSILTAVQRLFLCF